MKEIVYIFITAIFLVACTNQKDSKDILKETSFSGHNNNLPKLEISEENDTIIIKGETCSDVELMIPMTYIKYEYKLSKEEQKEEEKTRERLRKERLNCPRRIHVIFDGTYNGYNVDAVFHPDSTYETIGMARYHFTSKKHDFYVETAFTWNWAFDIPNYERLKLDGETIRVKLDTKKVVQGTDRRLIPCDPFFFKDVDFDGEKEILFREGGYHGSYFAVYKILRANLAEVMLSEPYNNIIEPYSQSVEDDTVSGTFFDYSKKTITINEPMGAAYYYHDVFKLNLKSHDRLKPMKHHEGKHTEGGACFIKYEYSTCDRLDSVYVYYSTQSNNWEILAMYKRLPPKIKLCKLELSNIQDRTVKRTLSWERRK